MAKADAPLKVEIPRPSDEGPAWSRVGIIAALGFVVGIAWPRIAGVKIGPSAPDDDRPTTSAAALSSGTPAAAPAPPSGASASPSAAPQAPSAPAADPAAANKELVVIGPGKVTRCRDKKGKKIEDCGELAFDAIATPRLSALAACPSAIGLDAKMSIGFEVDFERKDVQVVKAKKNSLPTSTINGILQCAAHEFAGITLDDIAHKYKRYTVFYTAAFYPPGKHPEGDGKPAEGNADGAGDGASTSPTEAAGQATVNWDTALVRKEPKDGEVIARLVRGTKVKLMGRQNDWYKIEQGTKTGWVHRASIGL